MLSWSWSWGGPFIFGLTLGYVGGRSKPGTAATLLGTVVAFIGSISIFFQNAETAGMFMGAISFGFFFGVTIGIPIRGIGLYAAHQANIKNVLYPGSGDE